MGSSVIREIDRGVLSGAGDDVGFDSAPELHNIPLAHHTGHALFMGFSPLQRGGLVRHSMFP